jgi:hypothetical protein
MKTKLILVATLVLFLLGSALAFVGVVKAHSLVAVKATQAYADHMGDLRSVYTLPWSVIGSGGMGGTAGSYTIHSTLGQPVAGSVDGGSYHLTSGFWTEVIETIEEFFHFLPLIIR